MLLTVDLNSTEDFQMAIQIRFITESFVAPEYNCSAHTPEEWTELFGRPQLLLGIFSIVFSTACQILYLPALRVFYRERRMTCFKVMLLVALADMGGLACFGTLFGVTMVRGMVFCSDPLLAWIVGSGEVFFWVVSSCNCILLVVNRMCELTALSWIFQGRTSAMCIIFTIIYGLAESLFTRPPVPNSSEQFCAFNPFIPGHAPDEYPNRPNMYHDCFLALCLPALFVLLFGIVRSKTSQLIHVATKSTSVQRLQAKIFTQASFVCFFFGASSSVWVFQEFLFVPPPSVLIAGMVMCQAVHGLPCLIYLVLNDAVRKEALRMVGRTPDVNVSLKVNQNSLTATLPAAIVRR